MDSKDAFEDVIDDCTGMASLVSENCMVLAYIVYDFTWGSSESVQRTSIRFPDGSQYAMISETSGRCIPGSCEFSSTGLIMDVSRLSVQAFPDVSTGTTATQTGMSGRMAPPPETVSSRVRPHWVLSRVNAGSRPSVLSNGAPATANRRYSPMSWAVLEGNVTKIPSPESGDLSSKSGASSLSGGNISPLLSIGVTRAK